MPPSTRATFQCNPSPNKRARVLRAGEPLNLAAQAQVRSSSTCSAKYWSLEETYAGTRRTESRGCRFMNLYSDAQNGLSNSSAPAANKMRPQAFLKLAHQYAVGGCHFSGPLYEPFCTTSRDPYFLTAFRSSHPTQAAVSPLQFCSRTAEHHTQRTVQRRQSTLDDTHQPQACAKCLRCSQRGTARGDRERRRPVTSSTMRTPLTVLTWTAEPSCTWQGSRCQSSGAMGT